MRISNISVSGSNVPCLVFADVEWENSAKSPVRIEYQLPADALGTAEDVHNALLLACFPVAMFHAEHRLRIEGNVCPVLMEGVRTAAAWLKKWYGTRYSEIAFETLPYQTSAQKRSDHLSGMFLSGGVDSLAALRHNRLTIPSGHPRSISAGVLVEGFDIGHLGRTESSQEIYRSALSSLEVVANDANVSLIHVATNLRKLEPDLSFWVEAQHGAALSSIAHLLGCRYADFTIAATNEISDMEPWGSHPLLDSNYSSTSVSIHHALERMSRYEKTQLVAGWAAALQSVRVCTHQACSTNVLNCGKCEKCIRTMTALEAIGALATCDAFPIKRMSAELLDTVTIWSSFQLARYGELIAPLTQKGRHDLATLIRKKCQRYRFKESVKKIDRRFLCGAIQKLKKAASRS